MVNPAVGHAVRRGRTSRSAGVGALVNALVLATAVLATVVLETVVLAGAPSARADDGVTTTVLAEHLELSLTSVRAWVLRDEQPLDESAHGHAAGFLYAAEGDTILGFDDAHSIIVHEGEAAWMPWRVGHLHRSTSGLRGGSDVAGSTVGASVGAGAPNAWAFLLETEPESRKPGARWVGPPFRGLGDGAYTVRLSVQVFAPGVVTPPRRHAGPELLYLRPGRWEITDPAGRAVVEGERVILIDPAIPYALRAVGDGPARLLRLSLIPEDSPPAEELPPDALD